jgi:hypothetical protein
MQRRFSIAPLPAAFLERVRREGIDDLGQPVKRLLAEGGEPCRDALRRAEPGEELILASFTPFSKPGPYREYGPVFVLASGEPRSSLGDGYLRERFVIRAYSHDEAILDAAMVTHDEADETISRFFATQDTAFLHARFPTYGCFACRIERD